MIRIHWLHYFLLANTFLFSDLCSENAYEKYSPYVAEIREEFTQQMWEEFHLIPCGGRQRMHEKIEKWGLQFTVNHRATLEEARALQVIVMQKFIEAIHNHKKIRPFLEIYPFNDRIEVTVTFQGAYKQSMGDVTYVDSISGIALNEESRNKLFYYTEDPFKGSNLEFFSESYEDAVKLVAASPPIDPAVHQTSESEELVEAILKAFTDKMSAEHDLYLWSIGVNKSNDIEEIGAKFNLFKPATQAKARALLLQITEQLLQAFNSDEKLKPHLKEFPFPSKRLKIRLYFNDNRFLPYHDGSMEEVTLVDNELTYVRRQKRNDDSGLHEHAIVAQEMYEEALKENEQTSHAISEVKSASFLESIYNWIINIFKKDRL